MHIQLEVRTTNKNVNYSSVLEKFSREDKVREVIQITEKRYKEYQQGAWRFQRSTGKDIVPREIARKILDAAFIFKDVIKAGASLDPTEHAASAWGVVSLGLTMAQNHFDLQNAVFKSPDYLADVLARSAFAQRNFYHEDTEGSDEIGHALVALNKAILQYTAEVLAIQNHNKIEDWVTSISDKPITQLQNSIKDKEQKLNTCIQWQGILQNKDQAEKLLTKIDKEVSELLDNLISKFNNFNLPFAKDAPVDPQGNEHEARCLKNTRVDLLHQVSEWAELPDSKCIFWLCGMAGTGKSTIARTIAEGFKEKEQLAASFFFKKDEADRNNARKFIPTLARQLMKVNLQFADGLTSAIEEDQDIPTKALKEQFERLLCRPLQKLKSSQETPRMVIVIDALDECNSEKDIHLILKLLPELKNSGSLHLRIFLTSRPELPINEGFKKHNDHQDLILHEVPHPVVKHDIRVYLDVKFSEICEKHDMTSSWPGDAAIDQLVHIAVPLLIFAATMCRFIGDEDESPKERLGIFLNDRAAPYTPGMDRIYLPILEQLTNKDEPGRKNILRRFQEITGVIILLATPLSVVALAQLIEYEKDDVMRLLKKLRSVLHVPGNLMAFWLI